jgi:hypothetical protein
MLRMCRRLTARRLPSFRLSKREIHGYLLPLVTLDGIEPPSGPRFRTRTDPVAPCCRSVPAVMRC